MTDVDLQTAIIRELESMCKDESLMMPVYEPTEDLIGQQFKAWKDFNIYRQDMSYKNEEMPDEQEDYLIVVIWDEDTDDAGDWIVEMHIIIGITLYEEEHQGNLILLNLMNQIDYRLRTKGILGKQYEKELKAHKRINECEPNRYECDYITYWKIPQIIQEGLEELL